MEKIISVIIPCYNEEKYIDRCFESLKNQTIGIDQMELIFVNDASTDSSLEHLLEFERQFPETEVVFFVYTNRVGVSLLDFNIH